MEKECCSHKTKERPLQEYKNLIHRLNRIEGQIRGIRGMVEKNAYCTDILVQVSAVNAALNSFNKALLAQHIRTCVAANAALNAFTKELLADHIKTCVAQDIRNGKDETVDELVATLQKLMK